MKKFIEDFTGKFLNYSRVTLFILFGMNSFNWYDTTDPTVPDIVTSIINLVGLISFSSWVYAIGHKANKKLISQDINLSIFKYFNFGFIVLICTTLAMFFLSADITNIQGSSGVFSYHISYTQPWELALLLVLNFIFIILIAAKVLVSAEENKEAVFNDYIKTFLLITFSLIGLWYIQGQGYKNYSKLN